MRRKKDKPEKIRPFEGDKEIAQKIADETGLDVVDVLSLALSAGLKAIEENDFKMPLPLKFQIAESSQTARRGAARPPVQYTEYEAQASVMEDAPGSRSKGKK